MSGADLFEDGYPHGTVEGYAGGCKGGSCPAGVEHGLSCKRAQQLSAGDYRYKRLVREGLTPAQIAEHLNEHPHELGHAPDRQPKRRDIDAALPITTTRPMRTPEEHTMPTPKDIAKPASKPTTTAASDFETFEKPAPLTTDRWTNGLAPKAKTARLAEIRDWCRANGFPGLPTHGKIPQDALAAYAQGFDAIERAVVVGPLEPRPVEGGIIPALLAREAESSVALDGDTFTADEPTEETAQRSDLLDETRERVTKPCNTGKHRYETAEEAHTALERIRAKRLEHGDEHIEQRAYECGRCDGWHLTSWDLNGPPPKEIHNTLGEALQDVGYQPTGPEAGMRARPKHDDGVAVVREVETVGTYTVVRLSWLPDPHDEESWETIDWLDHVTVLTDVSEYTFDRFGSDDMAEALDQWEREGRTWRETFHVVVDAAAMQTVVNLEALNEHTVVEPAERPDWADVTIPEDIRKARTTAALLEEDNARLLQLLHEKDEELTALAAHAADLRLQVEVDAAPYDEIQQLTRSLHLVLTKWADAEDRLAALADAEVELDLAADVIDELKATVLTLENGLALERAVNERLTPQLAAHRPWWKRGRG